MFKKFDRMNKKIIRLVGEEQFKNLSYNNIKKIINDKFNNKLNNIKNKNIKLKENIQYFK